MEGVMAGDTKKRRGFHVFTLSLCIILIIALFLTACEEEGEVISKPDEYTRIYEANEDVILQAIARVFKEKGFGVAKTDSQTGRVESDQTIQNDWRTKCIASVKKINWKECDVTLSVIMEKKTSKGWEMRRLLGKKQYDNFFDAIDLQVYKEMYKVK
jgi:hypothetical protein